MDSRQQEKSVIIFERRTAGRTCLIWFCTFWELDFVSKVARLFEHDPSKSMFRSMRLMTYEDGPISVLERVLQTVKTDGTSEFPSSCLALVQCRVSCLHCEGQGMMALTSRKQSLQSHPRTCISSAVGCWFSAALIG